LVAGTPVLQADGTSRRIEDLPLGGGIRLFAPSDSAKLLLADQTELMPQGVAECVSLVLQDGRKLICTPDHQILCADGRWLRADHLEPGKDRVVVGLEAPLDEPGADEPGYVLRAGELTFTMDEPQGRQRALAFARLVGHLISDGSISVAGQGRMNVGQAVDRETVLDDIERIAGKRPAGTRYDDRKWSIALPLELTTAILALPGVVQGRRIDQPSMLPAFVQDPSCPVSMVREFLGGLFGADGWAPSLHRSSERDETATFSAPAFSQTAKPEHVAKLREVMDGVVSLLRRCGVETEGAAIGEYPTRRSASTYAAAQDGMPRTEVRLQLPDGLSFIERVGFRYCVDKALRASAAAVYWRTVRNIDEQRLWMASRLEEQHRERPELAFSQARTLAATALEERETPSSRTTRCSRATTASPGCRGRTPAGSSRCTGMRAGSRLPSSCCARSGRATGSRCSRHGPSGSRTSATASPRTRSSCPRWLST
jgi:hypothetical protein